VENHLLEPPCIVRLSISNTRRARRCSYEDGTSDAVLATTPFFVDSDTFVCCGICKDAESQ
jgi:hypothetical protein